VGLLDELLAGLAGQGQGPGGPAPSQSRQAGAGPDMSRVLAALVPVVLGMIANRGGQGASPTPVNRAPAGGNLGDLLGQVLGGGGGAAGGLGGLLEQLQRGGFREQADSWVSRGANQPISPSAISDIFGKEGLEAISRHAGISPDETSHGLSALLPEIIDRMTPDGEVPAPHALADSVDDFARRLRLG
jgi:uncharacterized protein YidB (DUF937 family)